MSKGESCATVRRIIFDSYYETTGRNRVNIKNILDIPLGIFDALIIKSIVFSHSEWDKVKKYADDAREKGKIVIFEACYALQDDDLCCSFWEYESDGLKYLIEEGSLKDLDNNDGVKVLQGKFTAGGWDMINVAYNIKKIVELEKKQEKNE